MVCTLKDIVEGHTLVYEKTEQKEINTTDDNGNEQKIQYKNVKIKMQENGTSDKKSINFDFGCKATSFKGIELKGYKLTGQVTFDIKDEETMEVIDIEKRTQKEGFVKITDDLKSKRKGKKMLLSSDKPIKLYKNYDENSEVLTVIEPKFLFDDYERVLIGSNGEKLSDDSDETPKEEWVKTFYGGNEGYFSKFLKKIAKLVFDHKNQIKPGKDFDTLEKIEQSVLKKSIYFHQEEDGKYSKTKNPSTFFKYNYFEDKKNGKLNYVKLSYPSKNKKGEIITKILPLEFIKNKSIEFRPSAYCTTIYVGGGKISPTIVISSGLVTDISEIKQIDEQEENIKEYSKDDEYMKMMEEKAKLFNINFDEKHTFNKEPEENDFEENMSDILIKKESESETEKQLESEDAFIKEADIEDDMKDM